MTGSSEVSLADAYRLEEDVKVRERILMISLLKKGKSTYEVADMLHCSQSTVSYWKIRYDRYGMEGLKTRKQPGRPPEIPETELERIRGLLDQAEWWTAKHVRQLIYKESGVLYSERHVQRLLHTWGFDLIRPGKRHINKASEEEIHAFKKKQKRHWWRRKRRAGTSSAKTNQ